ncbi:MAG: hypothetical protein PHP00_09265 [Thiotrichaceae bacterium]|nr:hypothetical protein [Thiotrichaceae bacterium]
MNFDFLVETVIQSVAVTQTEHGQDVLITILDHEANTWILTAISVDDFILNWMCQINIIECVNFFDAESPDIEYIQDTLLYLIRSRDPKEDEDIKEWETKFVAQRVQKMKESGYVLLEIEPVAGAYIVLLAEKILLEKV